MWLSSQDLILREDDHMANNISMGAETVNNFPGSIHIIDRKATNISLSPSNESITINDINFLQLGLTNLQCGLIISGTIHYSQTIYDSRATQQMIVSFPYLSTSGSANFFILFSSTNTSGYATSFNVYIYTIIFASKIRTDYKNGSLNYYVFSSNLISQFETQPEIGTFLWNGADNYLDIKQNSSYNGNFTLSGNLTFTTFYQSIS